MPFVNINGLDVGILIKDKAFEGYEERGLSEGMSANGSIISTSVRQAGIWKGKVEPMAIAEAKALHGMLMGMGCVWPFDDSLYCHKGLPATLTRATIRYKSDGTSVASGSAAYETGPNLAVSSTDKALWIEEGTTNLLTANQSSVETNTTGFNINNGTTITRDTTEYWNGTASLKCVTPNVAATEGWYTSNTTVTASLVYTASVYLKGSGTVQLFLQERTAADALVGATASSVITLASTWTRYSVTRTFGATGERARIYVYTNAQQGITFYADGLQIEQKAYATSWHLGGATRNAEVVTIPASIFDKNHFTVGMWFKPTSNQAVSGKFGRLWAMFIDSNNWWIYYVHETGKPYFSIRSNGTTYDAYSASDSVLNINTWYLLVAYSNGSTITHTINGVNSLSNAFSYQQPVGTLPTNMYLGCSSTGVSHANGLYSGFFCFPYAMTTTQILAYYNTSRPFATLPRVNVYGDWVNRLSSNPISCLAKVGDIEEIWGNGGRMGTFDLTLREV
jgi:hypothetical protein